MLGVYCRANTAAMLPRLLASTTVSDTSFSDTLVGVVPIAIPANSTVILADVSAFFRESGVYYVKATVSPDADFTVSTGSNTVSYFRPDSSLDRPENVRWSKTSYGRADWDAVSGAASYQVSLYSFSGIVAHRNVNTTHFTFSSEWLDLDHIEEKGYYFKVTALSPNIYDIANSPESLSSGTLTAPQSTELTIITQPASRYASLGEDYGHHHLGTG